MKTMNYAQLNELPPSPPGNTGWPWTEESAHVPQTMPNGKPWPKISIVTPSYNQGQFIEETIRSILLQGYPNLEYIIIDGGSTDNSVEIIKKYEPWLAYWISEKDCGQSHAINKGFRRANGEIYAWLNSDDFFLSDTLKVVGSLFAGKNKNYWISGTCNIVDCFGNRQRTEQSMVDKRPFVWFAGIHYCKILQQSVFWSKHLFDIYGPLDESLHYCMDFDLFVSFMFGGYPPHIMNHVFSSQRLHEETKTSEGVLPFKKEMLLVMEKYRKQLRPEDWQFIKRAQEFDLTRCCAEESYNSAHKALTQKRVDLVALGVLRSFTTDWCYALHRSIVYLAKCLKTMKVTTASTILLRIGLLIGQHRPSALKFQPLENCKDSN